MSEWDEGYVTDVNYTYGYYAELNPLRIKLSFLTAGLAPPDVATACELGFGQGITTNFHAAASTTEWYGTDFNPSQAAYARNMAETCGNNARLYDESFAEFCHRKDLPDFDFIALHGIFSWVSPENKNIIVDFIRRKLKVGGVVYISYNTMPGWSPIAPIRHLMAEHGAVMGSSGSGVLRRVDDAIQFVDRLFSINPRVALANPHMRERFDKIKGQNRSYVAHEYFNGHWHPMPFSEMSKWLEPAKLQFGSSAHYIDQIDVLNMTSDQVKFLNEIPDLTFRESVRDYIVNQQFRRDYWVKGVRRLTAEEQADRLRGLRIMLVSDRSSFEFKVKGPLGEATLNEAVYAPVLDALSGRKPVSIAEVENVVKRSDVKFAQIIQAVLVLAGQGAICNVQDDRRISKARLACDKLNSMILVNAIASGEINHLASPITGGGVTTGRFPQLFMLAAKNGRKQPEEWADFVWDVVSRQGQKVVKDGKKLESTDENKTEIIAQAQAFAATQLPVLKSLHVV